MAMKRVNVRRVGVTSIYMLIPVEWARAINLEDNDLAYLKPIEGRLDKFYQIPLIRTRGPIGAVRWT